jgi:cobalt-zinc-cadmium efflux system outer membrane protein
MPIRLLATLLILATASSSRADVVPEPPRLPAMLTLDEALRIFRERGLDLLIADATVYGAEGDVKVAGAIPNLGLAYSYSHAFNYNPMVVCPPSSGGECSPDTHTLTASDNAALEDSLSGKRYLRLKAARAALAAARLSRADAQRTLEFQVKQMYIQAVLARDALDFALEVQKSNTQTLDKVRLRFEKGAISEADEAKIETAKLESDQAVDAAMQALRLAKVSLAFLLGVRGPVPDYSVEQDLPKFLVSPRLSVATRDQLLSDAFEHRPDLRAQRFQRERSAAALALARRLRFPDLDLQLGFSYAAPGGGANSGNTVPPTLIAGISGNLPLFYQQQGEIRKADADRRTQDLQLAKQTAQVVSDVESAWASFDGTRKLVTRMEQRLLERSRRARDLVAVQYDKGAVSLLELLDAQRQFIITNVEYLNDLASFWTAVFQLEQAVGMDLR